MPTNPTSENLIQNPNQSRINNIVCLRRSNYGTSAAIFMASVALNTLGGVVLAENSESGASAGYMMISLVCLSLTYGGLAAGYTMVQSRREIDRLRNAGYGSHGDTEMAAIAPSNQVTPSPQNDAVPRDALQLSASVAVENPHAI